MASAFTSTTVTAASPHIRHSSLSKPYAPLSALRLPANLRGPKMTRTSFATGISAVVSADASTVTEDERKVKVHERPNSFGRFRKFGGRYVPETLVHALSELEVAFHSATKEREFQLFAKSRKKIDDQLARKSFLTKEQTPKRVRDHVLCWRTFRIRRKHTARTRNARSTPFTRSLSTRREKIAWLPKGSDVTIANNLVMVDKQNPFSIRRPRLPRRLC